MRAIGTTKDKVHDRTGWSRTVSAAATPQPTNLEEVFLKGVLFRVVMLQNASVERRHLLGARAQIHDGPGVQEFDPVGKRLVVRGKHRALVLEELPLGAVILVNVRYQYLVVSRYFDISNESMISQTILGRYTSIEYRMKYRVSYDTILDP